MGKKTIIYLILILIIFTIGFLTGLFLEKPTALCPDTKITRGLNSKTIMVSELAAGGQISNISGRTITLNKQGENLDVLIKEGASISSLVFSGKNNSFSEATKIGFTDLKNGDNVYINLEILPSGDFQGTSVTVVPAP